METRGKREANGIFIFCLNHVLLVTDSNGRNLVNPQVVRVPKKCKFDLSVVAIPGGRISHGQKEILDGRHFEKLDFLICALGSNNFSNNCQEHTIDILEELESFTAAVQIIYPRVKNLNYNTDNWSRDDVHLSDKGLLFYTNILIQQMEEIIKKGEFLLTTQLWDV
uniref:uncharacterized protein LOC120335363 n=1 Tax=Styela clava TaxID=7725 RepID=UPI00193A8691|nr:uncharacterized protein LOC120335363 [Styela clava]